jgi:citronellol/citronellal dehydrogenase
MYRDLAGKTLLITGASRGIGKAIAVRAAQDGANVAVAAKTVRKHPVLPGTIYTAVEEIEEAGGSGLAVQLDVRDPDSVESAVEQTVGHFGQLDILVNNASAIMLLGTRELPLKRYDLMFNTNVRGTWLMSQASIPHLKKSENPHVLNLSPPLNLNPVWFKDHVAYTMAKYGMSMCVLGMAEEFRGNGIAFNALWPRTVIATAALNMLEGAVKPENCRNVEIMADAAHAILCQDSKKCSGNFYLDEDVLRSTGVRDFDKYAVEPCQPLMKDLFLDD